MCIVQEFKFRSLKVVKIEFHNAKGMFQLLKTVRDKDFFSIHGQFLCCEFLKCGM